MPTIADDRLPLSLSPASPFISHITFSLPFAFLFFLAVSLSLYLSFHLSLFLLLPFRDATMCVVRRGSRQGRLANNTLQFFRSPPLAASPCPSRSLPTTMPPREKGKKVPKIQSPVRKSSSMNASTSPSALNRHPPYPLPYVAGHLRSPSATICMMRKDIFLSRARKTYLLENHKIAARHLETTIYNFLIDHNRSYNL